MHMRVLYFPFVVIKSGVDALKNTASDLIGRSGKEELARQLYKEIRATDGVISAIDMMLHDYGPDRYSGSVNIEIDHKRSIERYMKKFTDCSFGSWKNIM